MSLLGTLAKVAIGVALAKGVSGMMKGGGSSSAPKTGGGQLGSQAGGQGGGQSGGLGDILGQLGGAGGSSKAGAGGGLAGGLGGLLEQLGGAAGGKGGGGGLGDLLGNLAGGNASSTQPRSSGGGSVFDQLAGNAPATRNQGGTFGELLNESLNSGGEPPVAPSQEEEASAALMLRAMIQAAKADGRIDEDEKARLMENLEDVSPEEREFVNAEFAAPIDIDNLVNQTPRGMEQQVYAMSVMGIKLDDQNEAKYLHELATAMGVGQQEVNGIHDQLGAPRIYS